MSEEFKEPPIMQLVIDDSGVTPGYVDEKIAKEVADRIEADANLNLSLTTYINNQVNQINEAKQDKLTFDDTPTEDSLNPVTSDGIFKALGKKQDALTIDDDVTEESSNLVKSSGIKKYVDTTVEEASENLWKIQGECKYSELPTEPNKYDVWILTEEGSIFEVNDQIYWNGTEWKLVGRKSSGSGLNNLKDSSTNTGLYQISNSAKYVGENSISLGEATAVGKNCLAEGSSTTNAQGENSIAVGDGASAIGKNSVAFGYNCGAQGDQSIACGNGSSTSTSATNSVALGSSHTDGENSFSCGTNANAQAKNSAAFGATSIAAGENSFAEGVNTYAMGKAAHAEGNTSQADGDYSHAEGNGVVNAGNAYGHAEGKGSVVLYGNAGHAEGIGTYTSNDGEHAQGSYNSSTRRTNDNTAADATIHTIGIGTDQSNRKNSVEVRQNGDVYIRDLKDALVRLQDNLTKDLEIVYTKDAKTLEIQANGTRIGNAIDVSDFIIDGMVSDVKLESEQLVITWNTDAGSKTVTIPLSDFWKNLKAGTNISIGTDGSINVTGLATVATTGSYNDLKDKPSTPGGSGGCTAVEDFQILEATSVGEDFPAISQEGFAMFIAFGGNGCTINKVALLVSQAPNTGNAVQCAIYENTSDATSSNINVKCIGYTSATTEFSLGWNCMTLDNAVTTDPGKNYYVMIKHVNNVYLGKTLTKNAIVPSPSNFFCSVAYGEVADIVNFTTLESLNKPTGNYQIPYIKMY